MSTAPRAAWNTSVKGIKAIDDKDGDVSDSLTVESVYEVDDSNVVVTYVAKDASNNIAKLKRNMSTDPEKMKESRENDDDTSEGTEPTPVPVEDVETGDSSPEESDSGEASADDGLTPTPTPAGDNCIKYPSVSVWLRQWLLWKVPAALPRQK